MNYCITRRELLGLIFGLKQFRQYCLGRKIIVRTHHAPLISIQTTLTPSAQMCRWLDLIAEFDMIIQHRPGARHGNADACGRANTSCTQCKLSAESYKKLDDAALSSPEVVNSLIRVVRATRNKASSNPDVTENSLDMATCQQQDPDIKPIIDA
jgi:RNase H-like domain found in reverse transcriptase